MTAPKRPQFTRSRRGRCRRASELAITVFQCERAPTTSELEGRAAGAATDPVAHARERPTGEAAAFARRRKAPSWTPIARLWPLAKLACWGAAERDVTNGCARGALLLHSHQAARYSYLRQARSRAEPAAAEWDARS